MRFSLTKSEEEKTSHDLSVTVIIKSVDLTKKQC